MLELLYDALGSEHGLIVRCDNPLGLRVKLYALKSKDPDFASLSFVLSPTHPKTDLWIIKTSRST